MKPAGDVTRLLADLNAGKAGADDALLSVVYEELRSLASRYMSGEGPAHTLQTTALVHEAYVRLAQPGVASWQSRSHFLRVAARAMRRVLIQHARGKRTDKRGGGRQRQSLEEAALPAAEPSLDVLELDAALRRLRTLHERLAEVVELRFFGGLSVEETAEVLGTSPVTVKRDWKTAKAWLRTEITKGEDPDRAEGHEPGPAAR